MEWDSNEKTLCGRGVDIYLEHHIDFKDHLIILVEFYYYTTIYVTIWLVELVIDYQPLAYEFAQAWNVWK